MGPVMRMIVTRPEPDAQASAERLAALGIEPILAPLLTRQNLSARLPPAEGFAALAVTSANALRSLAERPDFTGLLGIPLFAVGDRTAHEARQLGFSEVHAAQGTLDDLATLIALARPDGAVLYPCGKHLSGDLAHALAPQGLMVVTVPVYEMVAETQLPEPLARALSERTCGAVLHYSARTAQIFSALVAPHLPEPERRHLAMLCLSENVAAPLIETHFNRVMLADHPSEEAMMALALAFTREQTGP
ncbi:MAG: uroporphyrinogen-III synthase [Devosia sp.]|uniref:uroporphyrinogen-III synthase n=1 Tax=Devosia sp. TaxID=1871048 RepID=UPI0024CAD8E8|nr:uroporphyrinogen-III synthase [Devosia sp.]UYN98695.1 MAG: uroporphyrinogen-III synthase [Devosia sp.]